ncbi:MAG: DUF5658 family protein [Armatimonadota bacterium]
MFYKAAELTRRTVCLESLVFAAICLADAFITVLLVASGHATEANPIMARCFDYGIPAFWAVKMTPLIALVGVAEWYRQQNAEFTKLAMQAGIAGYVALYIWGVFCANML